MRPRHPARGSSGQEKGEPGPAKFPSEISDLVPRARFELARLTAPPPQDGVSTSSTTWARAREGACSKASPTVQASYLRFGFAGAGAGDFAASVLAGARAGGEAVCFSGPDDWFPGTGTAAPPVAGAGAVWPVGSGGVAGFLSAAS